jgi:Kef-type K+ transport system membrane component KefB
MSNTITPTLFYRRTEARHNMKKLILSVFIITFGFATATHAQQVNTLFTSFG